MTLLPSLAEKSAGVLCRLGRRCMLAAGLLALAGPALAVPPPAAPPSQAAKPAESARPEPGPVSLPAAIPLRRDTDRGGAGPGLGVAQAFIVVILLFFLGVWVIRNRKPLGVPKGGLKEWREWLTAPVKAEGVKVIQAARLTPRATVHIVQWQGHEWMLGCTDRQVTVLGRHPLGGPQEPTPVEPDHRSEA